MSIRHLVAAGFLLIGFVGQTGAAEPAVVSTVTIRVAAIHGIGPDGSPHDLFRDPQGVTVPLTGFDRLAERFDAKGLADGAYYQLEAEIVDGLQLVGTDGSAVGTTAAADGSTTQHLPLAGAVVVSGGRSSAFGLMPGFLADSWRRAGDPARGERGRVDEEDDD